jgi:hypothetical protein
MDPSTSDLSLIQTIDLAIDWCGISAEAWADTKVVLGDIRLLREVALIEAAEYAAAILTIVITVTPAAAGNVAITRPISLVERGRLRSLRRVCLMVLGRDPEESPTQVGASPSSSTTSPSATPSADGIALSAVLDQITSTKIIIMEATKLRGLYSEYSRIYGGFPATDCDPTVEQISALDQVVRSGGTPWADFAIFGPHGKRILKKLTFTGWTPGPDGTLVKREMAGPPTVVVWRKCWKTFRIVALLLKMVSPEALDAYHTMISQLGEQFPTLWWLVYQADYRMRSEFWDRIRMEIEHKRASLSAIDPIVAQTLVPYDVAMPWDAVIRASTSQDYAYFWTQEVRDKAVDLKTHTSTLYDIKHDSETIELASEADKTMPWMRGNQNKRAVEKSNSNPSNPKKDKRNNNNKSSCSLYNSSAGCSLSESNCPQHAQHTCATCGARSHGESTCWVKNPSLKPSGSGKGGKGKGGKGKGGKGKG